MIEEFVLLAQEVIHKKSCGKNLGEGDLIDFFSSFQKGEVADYQMSAFLMACCLKGMNFSETLILTKILRDSGKVFSWGEENGSIYIDKHSTGGVGDKTSLIILPLCLLEGVRVPMVSGRGLGHTGGTVDKMEAIPGLQMQISMERAHTLMQEFGGFMMCQTDEIAPLDRRLYALRDVTATVASIPLITASILSKKLAEGLSGLVLDVKFGSGAFIQDKNAAESLSQTLIKVGRGCGLAVRVILSSMNSPLGRNAGNILELRECVDIFTGSGPQDTLDLSLELARDMVQLAFPKRCGREIYASLQEHLRSGRAFKKFAEIVAAQGGDPIFLEKLECFPETVISEDVLAPAKGVVTSCDVKKLGLSIVELGGGRIKKEDKIDPWVGLSHLKHQGETLEQHEPLARVYGRSRESVVRAKKIISSAYTISEVGHELQNESIIWKKINTSVEKVKIDKNHH